MCIELAEEGIPERNARAGETLVVHALQGKNGLMMLVVDPDNPFEAAHPPPRSEVRVYGIPEDRRDYWGTGEVANAVCAPIDAGVAGNYDAFVFAERGPQIDLRAFKPGMRLEILSTP